MKRLFTGVLTVMLLLLPAVFFVACGDGGKEDDGGKTENKVYTVTVEESDFYSVKGQTTGATAGLNAYVIVVPEFAVVSVDKVLYNGRECIKSASEENRYEFIMPAENVEITVGYSFKDNESDKFLSWSGNNPATFQIDTETGSEGELNVDVTGGGFLSVYEENVFSLNQNAIPDAALRVSVTNKNQTNSAAVFTVHIDRSKIRAGTAQIVFRVKNGHNGTVALLVCTVTVTDMAA